MVNESESAVVDASDVGGTLVTVVLFVIALVVVAHADSTNTNSNRNFPHQAVEVVEVR